MDGESMQFVIMTILFYWSNSSNTQHSIDSLDNLLWISEQIMNQLIFSHTQKLCCFTGHHIFIKNCWREENYTLVSAIWITPFLYKGTSHSNGMLWKPRWHLLRKKTSPQIRWTDKLAVRNFGYKWIGYLSASTFPSFAVSADRKDMISNITYEE